MLSLGQARLISRCKESQPQASEATRDESASVYFRFVVSQSGLCAEERFAEIESEEDLQSASASDI